MTIGITIANLLTNHFSSGMLVPTGNIFAYVSNENTTLPAIIYTVDSLLPEYDKDGWVRDLCNFSVVSFSGDYATLQSIATHVRGAVELIHPTGMGRIEMGGQEEGYDVNMGIFSNKLNFNVEIKEY